MKTVDNKLLVQAKHEENSNGRYNLISLNKLGTLFLIKWLHSFCMHASLRLKVNRNWFLTFTFFKRITQCKKINSVVGFTERKKKKVIT